MTSLLTWVKHCQTFFVFVLPAVKNTLRCFYLKPFHRRVRSVRSERGRSHIQGGNVPDAQVVPDQAAIGGGSGRGHQGHR